MIFKKMYKIKGKIITKEDITNMLKNIFDKYGDEERNSIKIEAKFNDGTSIADKEISLFDNIYFEKIVIDQISVMIIGDNSEMVYINITSNGSSFVEVESKDKKLYNSVCHNIEESLKMLKNQNKIYLLASEHWGYFLLLIIIFAVEVFIIFAVENIFSINIPSAIISLMISIIPAFMPLFLVYYIENNYPINEFDFGQSSVNSVKKKTPFFYRIFIFIISNVILPILISIYFK